MTLKICPSCHKMFRSSNHHCPPSFRVRLAPGQPYGDDDDPLVTIYAYDAQEAALEFTHRWDIEDGLYPIADGQDLKIIVAPTESGAQLQTFFVSGEWIPHYTATQCATPLPIPAEDPANDQ